MPSTEWQNRILPRYLPPSERYPCFKLISEYIPNDLLSKVLCPPTASLPRNCAPTAAAKSLSESIAPVHFPRGLGNHCIK
jgi:hypothetical protein